MLNRILEQTDKNMPAGAKQVYFQLPQKTQQPTKYIYTVTEAAKFLGVSADTLRNWEASGKLIPKRTKGGSRRYYLQQLNKIFAARNPYLAQAAAFQNPPIPSTSSIPEPTTLNIFKKLHPVNIKNFAKPLYLFAGVSLASLLIVGLAVMPGYLVKAQKTKSFLQSEAKNQAKYKLESSSILGVSSNGAAPTGQININIPSSFNDSVTMNKDLTVNKLTTTEELTASNVIYSITAGDGISVSLGQSPTITNIGVLSLAGKTGALTLTAGTDITIDGLTVTNKSTLDTVRGRGGCSSCILDADVAAGLTISGGSVNDSPIGASTASTGAFTTLSASGATTLSSTLAVTGTTTLTGNITFTGGAASSIIPATDSIYDLGSATKQWGTVYASNLSVSGVNSAGQLISTYVPTSNTVSTGPLYINPTTATAGYTLAGFAVGGSAKLLVTSNGSLISGTDGSADLGSSSVRWNNLYVNTLTASGTNYSGQATFSYEPTSSVIGQGSIWINPTTATAAYPLFSVSVGGTEKARITSDGYLGLAGANDPGSTYFINAGANFNVTTAGALTATGITSSGTISFTDDVDLGATSTDTITLNGVIDSNLTFIKQVARTLQIADSTSTNTAGSALTIKGAAGTGTANGGSIALTAGAAGTTGASTGGSVTLTAGVGGTSSDSSNIGGSINLVAAGAGAFNANGSGGSIALTAAQGNGIGNAGNITLTAGKSNGGEVVTSNTGTAGIVTINAGAGATAGTNGGTINNGGAVNINGGAGGTILTGSVGGAINLTAGAGGGSNANAGGALVLAAGRGSATGVGGAINLTTGAGGSSSGTSGALSLASGTAASGANTGAVTISSGNVTGGGTSGALSLDVGTGGTGGAINIGTSALAKTITMGNNTGATALALTSGTGSQTFTSSVVSTTGTSSAFVFNDASLTTGTLMYLQATALTTGNLLDINTGSSIFSISNSAFTTSLPTNFTASGDVAIAYDINFTNPTTSYIKSSAPLNITAGETFNSTNLTLQTYNQGTVVIDTAATTGTSMNLLANGVTTGTGLLINANALTTGNAVSISSTSTGGSASTTDTLLNIARSGANTGATHTAYGIQSSVTNTGTTSVNVGGLFTATGATTNRGLEVAAMTGATSTGLTIGALSGTTADTGISIGAISGAAATGTGITIGNISTTGATNRGITLGTLTGGTGTNYQINTGILTSATTTTNAQLNLGGVVTTGGTTNYGINVGALSGTGTTNTALNITAMTSTGTSTGIAIGAMSGAGTANTGLSIGALSAATTSKGVVLGALSSATSTGLEIGALSGTTANTGLSIGAISGALGTGTGITIGNISTTGATNYGLLLGTMTGGSTSNYQISAGNITAIASATNIGISLGTIGGAAASSTNYMLTSGAISSTGTTNAQLNLGAVSGAAATNYGINIGNISGATANSYGINIGTIGGAGTASYGVNIGANSATATTNYGIQTGAISGAGTNNYGLYIGAVSGAVTGNFALFTAGGKVQFTCTTNNLAAATDPNCSDYAEIYNTDDSLEPGDIVTLDTSKTRKVTLSSTSYQKQIIGIYSTSPGMLIGADGITSAAGEEAVKNLPTGKVPVALTGRVPVKVSLENGPIEVGDYLTSSSTPGVAMKATKPGQVIGKAMEAFSCQSSANSYQTNTNQSDDRRLATDDCTSKILAFVNVTFADPNDVLANLALDENGNLVSSIIQNSSSPTIPTLQTSPTSLSLKDQIASISARLKDLESLILNHESSSPSASLTAEDRRLTASLNLTPPELLLATGSATLADLKVTSQATFSGILTAYDLSVQNTFKSLGTTTLGTTNIAGDLTVDGTLSISHNSLNSLTTLYLQNSPLAQGIDLFNGKVTISKDGNMVTQGDIKGTSITTEEVKIISGKTSGSAKIIAGTDNVVIANTYVKSASRILITPTTKINLVLSVTTKTNGTSFKVETTGTASSDITFDWWIINEVSE